MSTQLGLFLGPYSNPDTSDTDDTGVGSPVIEANLIAAQASVNIGEAHRPTNHPGGIIS